MQIDVIHGDRRLDRRYEAELALHFHYVDAKGMVRQGSGMTVELSRGGVRFHTDDQPPCGVYAEARIAWPFKLQNVCPLELVVRGAVVSSTSRGTVLGIESYEFRTCGNRSFYEPMENSGEGRVA